MIPFEKAPFFLYLAKTRLDATARQAEGFTRSGESGISMGSQPEEKQTA